MFALGILTIAVTGYLAIRVYSPVWFADDWQVPMDYIGLGGHYPLAKFWAQHNEHRVPFVKASILVDLFVLHGNHAILIALNFFCQIAEWLALIFFVRKLFRLERWELLTAIGVGAFWIVNPNQLQNVEWVFSSFFTTYTFAIAALGSLAAYKVDGWRIWIITTIASALLAEISLASGVLVLVVLPVSAILLGMSYRKAAWLAGAAALALTIYLVGYQSPANATNPISALAHADQIIAFLLAYFGESWHYILPQAGPLFAAIAMFGLVTLTAYKMIWRKPGNVGEVFLMSLALLCLLTGFVTALGRQGYGVDQAREGRYQTPAMLFWCALVLLLFFSLRSLGRNHMAGLIAFQAIVCVICFAQVLHLREIYAMHHNGAYIRNTAGAALESGVDALDRIRMIYPGPEAVPPTYAYLSSHGLMAAPLGMQSWMNTPLSSRFRVEPAGSCLGATDSVTLIGTKDGKKELFAAGWAFHSGGSMTRLVAATEDGLIEGLGIFGAERPDVIQVLPQVTELETGWNLYALVPITAKTLIVYGIVPGSGEVCEVPYTRAIPSAF